MSPAFLRDGMMSFSRKHGVNGSWGGDGWVQNWRLAASGDGGDGTKEEEGCGKC